MAKRRRPYLRRSDVAHGVPGSTHVTLPDVGSARIPIFAAFGIAFIFVQDSLHTLGIQAVATLGFVALAVLMLVTPRRAGGTPRAKLAAPSVLFLCWAAALLLAIPSKQGVQNYAVWFLFPASAVLVARSTDEATPERVYRWWKRAAVAAAAIYSLLVILHGPGYTGFIFSERGMGWSLLIALALIVPWQRYQPSKFYWVVWFLIVVIGLSLTRTAGALALLTVVALVISSRVGKLRPMRVVTALVVVGFAGYYAVTHIPAIRDRFTQGDQEFQYGGTKLNTSGRVDLWRATWKAAQDHLWIGHGPGQAQYLVQSIFVTVDHPHDDYLRLLYDTGWVGLGLWFVGVVMLAQGCWRRMRAAVHKRDRAVHLAGFIAMMDLFLGSITDNLTVSVPLILGIGTLLGMSMGLPPPNASPLATEDGEQEPLAQIGRGR